MLFETRLVLHFLDSIDMSNFYYNVITVNIYRGFIIPIKKSL